MATSLSYLADEKTRCVYGHDYDVAPFLRSLNSPDIIVFRNRSPCPIRVSRTTGPEVDDDCVTDFMRCARSRTRFYFVLAEHVYTESLSHINGIILDTAEKVIIHFEPYGHGDHKMDAYYLDHIIAQLTTKFLPKLPEYKIISNARDYLDIPGPQKLQRKLKRGGFCVSWCLLLLMMKLKSPETEWCILFEQISSEEYFGMPLLECIQRFTKFVENSVS